MTSNNNSEQIDLNNEDETCIDCNTTIHVLKSDQDDRIIDFFCDCNMKDFILKYRRFTVKDGFKLILYEDEYDDYMNKKDEQIFTLR